MNRDQLKDSLEEAANIEPLMFHPIDERSSKAWFPSNEAASLVVIIAHAWEDLALLENVRCKSTQDLERRLLFKYAPIELRSIVEQLERLQSIVFLVIANRAEGRMGGRISKHEESELRVMFREYHSIKRLVENDLLAIRNKIGAHRGAHPWEISGLWDALKPDSFRPLLRIIPNLFEVIRKLDIYDWTRIPEKVTIEISCSGLNDIEPS